MTNAEAYMVDGEYFCRECYKVQYYIGYEPDKLLLPDDFRNRLVLCDACEEDAFGRTVTVAFDDESWLIPWPEEPGYYWFHGWRYGDDGKEKPQTFLVRAYVGTDDKLSYLAYGRFVGYHLYTSRACGVWHPRRIVLPIPPQTPKGEV